MTDILEIVASNCAVSALLTAALVLLVRRDVNPRLMHLLFVLVLVKLFTPPIFVIGLSAADQTPVESVPVLIADTGDVAITHSDESASNPAPDWRTILVALWAAGSAVVFAVVVLRFVCFSRRMKTARDTPGFIGDMTRSLSQRLGLKRVPETRVLPLSISPAVWSLAGRPTILLPSHLVEQMPRERLQTIVAHELAHIQRKDHWVRHLELAAIVAFWWNPFVWWARKQLHELEERCCDAMVLQFLRGCSRNYAIALVETMEFLCDESRWLPLGATGANPTTSLCRRIEMLKSGTSARTLSVRAVITCGCLLAAPMMLAFGENPVSQTEIQSKLYRLGDLASDADSIVSRARRNIAPGQWRRDGGPFSIRQTNDGRLVVTASAKVHEKIALFLRFQAVAAQREALTKEMQRLSSTLSAEELDDRVLQGMSTTIPDGTQLSIPLPEGSKSGDGSQLNLQLRNEFHMDDVEGPQAVRDQLLRFTTDGGERVIIKGRLWSEGSSVEKGQLLWFNGSTMESADEKSGMSEPVQGEIGMEDGGFGMSESEGEPRQGLSGFGFGGVSKDGSFGGGVPAQNGGQAMATGGSALGSGVGAATPGANSNRSSGRTPAERPRGPYRLKDDGEVPGGATPSVEFSDD